MSKDDQQKRDSYTGRAGLWPPEKRPLVVPQATANLVSCGQLGVVCAALLLGGCAKGLQGLVGNTSNSSAFLTEGKQFSMSLTKHVISVDGDFAEVELGEKNDFAEVSRQLTSFKKARKERPEALDQSIDAKEQTAPN